MLEGDASNFEKIKEYELTHGILGDLFIIAKEKYQNPVMKVAILISTLAITEIDNIAIPSLSTKKGTRMLQMMNEIRGYMYINSVRRGEHGLGCYKC